MLDDLTLTHVTRSRLSEVDFDHLTFGGIFSDHMFSMEFSGGAWHSPQIMPYQQIPIWPGAAMLHYGQSVFEGLKAFRGVDGQVRVFRPDKNARRLNASARRLCMPPVEPDVFAEAIRRLVAVDHGWVPPREGQALYVRPLMIGTETHLDVRPDTTFRFLVMTAPVGSYFNQRSQGGVSLKAEEDYTRAATIGGLGAAKTAANYAASMFAGDEGRKAGFDQVLWLDGNEHRYVEEVGAMNIFFRLADTVVTPPLSGSILPGVTRDSVIALLRDAGVPVEERPIAIDEVMGALAEGRLREVFGAGTAAVISPVGRIHYRGETREVPEVPGEMTRHLYEQITGIQTGRLPDPHGWCMAVDVPEAAPAAAQGD